ncbi:MAG: SpoIIE family protein phosphatase [Bacteroidales bacterium]|nr:SpoIIE family protein phosphatase [Bacteroidales bacterium]
MRRILYILTLVAALMVFRCDVFASDTTAASSPNQNDSLTQFYLQQSAAYEKQGNYRMADSMYNEYIINQEQMFTEASMQELTIRKKRQADLEQDAFQEQEKAKMKMMHEMALKRIRIIMIAVVIGLILTAILAVFIIHHIRIKRKSNKQLAKANLELADQREKIKVQCDMITESKDELENINNQMINSIHYAEKIQHAVMASAGNYGSVFRDCFVYYRAKNIVSGDFYVATRCGSLKVFVVADCTGHGIPGGFLSMLGISAVKEALNDEEAAQNPGMVLDKLKAFVKSTFNAHVGTSAMEDGMDMTICCFDFRNLTLYYATANQTALVVRDGKPIKLKGDPMPVGKYYLESDNFSSHTFTLQTNDMVYLYTDGFQDQLGGDKALPVGRKLYSQNLVDFLCQNYSLPVEEQENNLDTFITEWRNGRDLTDDMTLAAVRVDNAF